MAIQEQGGSHSDQEEEVEKRIMLWGEGKEPLFIKPNTPFFYFRLADYFEVMKEGEDVRAAFEQARLDSEAYDPRVRLQTEDVRELFFDSVYADPQGNIAIPPQRLVLAHTLELIVVPPTVYLRMEESLRFTHPRDHKNRPFHPTEDRGEPYPFLTSNLAAGLHAGSKWRQTLEILNWAPLPVHMNVHDFSVRIDVSPLSTEASIGRENGAFPALTYQQERVIAVPHWRKNLPPELH